MKKAAAKAKESKKEETEKETTPKTEKPTSHDLKDYIGKYNNPGYGTITLFLENNALYFKGAGKKIWFKHNEKTK